MGCRSTQTPSQAQGMFQNSPTEPDCGVTPESGAAETSAVTQPPADPLQTRPVKPVRPVSQAGRGSRGQPRLLTVSPQLPQGGAALAGNQPSGQA